MVCYGCNSRKVGCHINCDAYRNYQLELEELKALKKQFRNQARHVTHTVKGCPRGFERK